MSDALSSVLPLATAGDTSPGIVLAYIVAAIFFIVAIKMLGRPETARRGNGFSALGMLIAVVATLLDRQVMAFHWIAVGLVIGAAIGVVAASKVKMTRMPEMVALFNGFGGLASLLVGWTEFLRLERAQVAVSGVGSDWVGPVEAAAPGSAFLLTAIFLTVLIGGSTFSGSLVAYGKLAEVLSGKPLVLPGQKIVNAALLALLLLAGVLLAAHATGDLTHPLFLAVVVGSLLLGLAFAFPVGGGDMPVLISLLNSLSGVAASCAGFAIGNMVLIVAGCLVGASGLILTVVMCKAMNRNLANVLFSGFGSAGGSASAQASGELKPISPEDASCILEAARSVVVVPGYGMAVAQAQHAVKELLDLLESNGAEVQVAIHPVAGRMPGHMNVLLAEANVPYEQLVEMDQVNRTMGSVDVAIVIGANDVVNPAAETDRGSPIYGMPIVQAHRARTVIMLKRGKGKGFSGIENALFTMPNTRMLYGDARGTIMALVGELKAQAAP